MIGVTPIESLFSNINLDKDGTIYESNLSRRRPNDSEFKDLNEKIDKSGIGEVKTLGSDEPTLLDFKDFNCDDCYLIDCFSLLRSMLNSPHAYNQNKAFTKHIVDAMMKSFEEKLELEVSICRCTKVGAPLYPFTCARAVGAARRGHTKQGRGGETERSQSTRWPRQRQD